MHNFMKKIAKKMAKLIKKAMCKKCTLQILINP